MIEEHGNMIVDKEHICVKSDESFKLGDFIECLRIELNEWWKTKRATMLNDKKE